MLKNNIPSHAKNLIFSLLLLLIHIGCFLCCSTNNNINNYLPTNNKTKKRKSSPKKNVISNTWSYVKNIFTVKNARNNHPAIQTEPSTPTDTTDDNTNSSTLFCSPRNSHYDPAHLYPRKRRAGSRSEFECSLYENPFLPLRNDIYPCPACGEIFQKPSLLEQHQVIKHAVSELRDGDSGKNIVWIIFKTGWAESEKHRFPKIHRILKIHNGQKILSRFEEYRETVKARAARHAALLRRDDRKNFQNERCIADGNELLRFHCTTFVCNLGQNGNSSICNQNYCSACGIIRAGFSPKLDGISTLSSSWRAHTSIPGDVEDEFAFMNVKRAMLVCRVISSRVGCDPMMTEVDKEDQGYDSLVGRGMTGSGKLDDDELLVFNPRAVLPCFVIVYLV